MNKIALAVICKDTEDEALLLKRLISNVKPHVDGVFVTGTYKDEPVGAVKKVCEEMGATYSELKWIDDFSYARNFNFSQVPKEYEHIMWSDVDDQWYGLDTLKTLIKDTPKDGYAFWYLYDFDEFGQPTVAHKKTMIVRNDGCAVWKGMIHEDLQPQRDVDIFFVEGIQRQHFSSHDRFAESQERNERIAKKEYELTGFDPRKSWNYGNALLHNGKVTEAIEHFKTFLRDSQSDEEKYLIRTRLAEAYLTIGDFPSCEEQIIMAIGMRPNFPDAYLLAGRFYFSEKMYDKAEHYLLQGLVRKPSYHSMIVFNPRDYDYNPMMLLANVYFNIARPDLALPVLKGCLKIQPGNEYVKNLVEEMEKETEELKKALEIAKEVEAEPDVEKKKEMILAVPEKLRPHPAIAMLRNSYFVKSESSGKDIVYYCGQTEHEFNPILFKQKGFGGSEEAVINLAREWAKKGYNVTVYNNCGPEIIKEDGVEYRPYWMFNPNDVCNTLILWRHPKLLDYDLKAKKVLVDMHDVISKNEFNEKRLAKVHKVMFKSEAHRRWFPTVPDEKVVLIPNGIDVDMFVDKVEKDQYLMINTSSPDRSMGCLPQLFKRVKEQVPEAKLEWAYGWDIWDQSFKNDRRRKAWKAEVIKNLEECGVTVVGRLPQHEVAKMYQRANILAYPTSFYEIDCISVRKAQLAGCIPVTTNFAALETTNMFGPKVPSDKTMETWSAPYQMDFSLMGEKEQDMWVEECVKLLKTPIECTQRYEMIEWAKTFNWTNIALSWENIFNGLQ